MPLQLCPAHSWEMLLAHSLLTLQSSFPYGAHSAQSSRSTQVYTSTWSPGKQLFDRESLKQEPGGRVPAGTWVNGIAAQAWVGWEKGHGESGLQESSLSTAWERGGKSCSASQHHKLASAASSSSPPFPCLLLIEAICGLKEGWRKKSSLCLRCDLVGSRLWQEGSMDQHCRAQVRACTKAVKLESHSKLHSCLPLLVYVFETQFFLSKNCFPCNPQHCWAEGICQRCLLQGMMLSCCCWMLPRIPLDTRYHSLCCLQLHLFNCSMFISTGVSAGKVLCWGSSVERLHLLCPEQRRVVGLVGLWGGISMDKACFWSGADFLKDFPSAHSGLTWPKHWEMCWKWVFSCVYFCAQREGKIIRNLKVNMFSYHSWNYILISEFIV